MPLISSQNPAYYSKATADFAPNSAIKVTDYQITEWIAPNGLHIKLNVSPFYDDPVKNKIIHPLGGVANSYRFDILYMGTMDQPNIFKCAVKGQNDFRGYQWGLTA